MLSQSRTVVRSPTHFKGCHQAFGLGHNPHSDTYKVARFFYRSLDLNMSGGYHHSLGMEVFAIGVDLWKWCGAADPPSYPIMPAKTTTFFKGSLLWTIEEWLLGHVDTAMTPGFVLFSLEDEWCSIVSLPPCNQRPFNYAASSLAKLRSELCMAHPTCATIGRSKCGCAAT